MPAANAYRIPDSVDDAQAALIEPLSCAVHGLRRIGPVIGEDILLTGAGTMGLLLLQLLNRAGARSVNVVDRKAARLQAAKTLGAASAAEDVAVLDRRMFGVAVDATGAPAAIEACFRSLDRGGRLLIFGVTNGDATVSLSPVVANHDWTYAIVTEAAAAGHRGFADHWRMVAEEATGHGAGACGTGATCWPRRDDPSGPRPSARPHRAPWRFPLFLRCRR